MEFKQLEAFVAVVDYGSFSEAARRLYLTQPTISAHIRSLEEELHSKLIIRTTKKTTVTTSGYQLYDSAVRMLEIRNNLLNNFTGAQKHMIDRAACTIPSSYLLPEVLEARTRIFIFIPFRQTAKELSTVSSMESSTSHSSGRTPEMKAVFLSRSARILL